ncbi:hypothetical protein C7C45_23095 [Micromonospora arborensis]|uniref:Uncharacterized protein n=1 Tax=Micromonospora arborensis TaxID=2116518 RepID=A0A318NXV3_9ACTN|nr:hypothetical protein [Micromonospora arborensis]PYC66964.1 hypothetical protein C7C45_23095 [Micromonospora arborensis]
MTFEQRLGFRRRQFPVVVLLGMLFLIATLPEFFVVLAGIDTHWRPGDRALDHLAAFANTVVKPPLEGPTASTVERHLSVVAFAAVPVVLAAALVCCLKVGRWRPVIVSVSALVLGLLAIPGLTWAIEALVGLVRLGVWLYRLVVRVIDWLSQFLAVVLVIGAGVAVLVGLYLLVQKLRARRWLTAGAWVGIVTLLVLAYVYGVFAFVGEVMARYVAPAFALVIVVLVVIMLVLLIAGLVVGFFGHLGRLIVVSAKGASSAGRDQASCADAAAGLGVALSMVLTAATVDAPYGYQLTLTWHETPYLSRVPDPVATYGMLMREWGERFLAPGFAGFNPTVDLAIAAAVALVMVLALLTNDRRWETGRMPGVVSLVMIRVGLTIAFAIPALLVTTAAKHLTADSDS